MCGCCINIISQQPPLEILWFRKECTHAIQWSGDPRKLVTQGPEGPRLSPRKSFEKWCQVVQWHSAPWSLQDTFRIRAIGNFISARKVEDASRLKSQFLANMSHEIRTPMTAITGYIDVLHDNSPDLMRSPIHAEAIHSIRRNCQHLLQVINDILDFSKIEAGKMTIQPCLCSPGDIVLEVENALRAVAEAKRLRFDVFSRNLIPKQILIDPTRLKQILINLIGNSIKFTNAGTVSVELNYKPSSPEWIEFLVRDTGPGIQPQDQDTLFRPFVQGDNSMTRKQGGTGLGLNISRQLARLMGGDVDLRSSILGVGTTLGIKLPIGVRVPCALVTLQREDRIDAQDLNSEKDAGNSIDDATPLSGMRVLLAEDGIDNQRLISFFIKKAGAHIVIVENGLLALEALESEIKGGQPFDVVLMDMQMPVLDGYESSRLIRNLGHQVPIVALTAHAMTGDREKCIEAGCNHYLTKPVDRKKLVSTLLECVKATLRVTS
jgi:signal transduction histidine kinase/CheY-like chemotaxis protein